MTREEFLTQLQRTLQGNVSSQTLQENLSYYREYITGEIQKGKSEEEVLAMLGDPGLIAKTIITAEDAGKEQKKEKYATYMEEKMEEKHTHAIRLDQWWKKLLLVLGVILIVMTVIVIVTGLVRFLAPIVLPVLVIVLVVRIFKNRR